MFVYFPDLVVKYAYSQIMQSTKYGCLTNLSFIYSVVECKVLNEIMDQLAAKHKNTKFIKCIATKAVENFQDQDLPALIFYKGGEL